MSKFVRKYGAAGVALLAAGAANAQSTEVFDASTYVSQITGTIPGMLAIGGAVFAVVLAIKSTKWGRRAL